MTFPAAITLLEQEIGRPEGALNKLSIEQRLDRLEDAVRTHPDIPLATFSVMTPLSRRVALLSWCAAWRQHLR